MKQSSIHPRFRQITGPNAAWFRHSMISGVAYYFGNRKVMVKRGTVGKGKHRGKKDWTKLGLHWTAIWWLMMKWAFLWSTFETVGSASETQHFTSEINRPSSPIPILLIFYLINTLFIIYWGLLPDFQSAYPNTRLSKIESQNRMHMSHNRVEH